MDSVKVDKLYQWMVKVFFELIKMYVPDHRELISLVTIPPENRADSITDKEINKLASKPNNTKGFRFSKNVKPKDTNDCELPKVTKTKKEIIKEC